MLKQIGYLLCAMVAVTTAPLGVTGAAQQPLPAAPADDRRPWRCELRRRHSRHERSREAEVRTCHRPDEKGRLTRISYRRTTPEGWEQTIKRMITLNNLAMEPAEARDILRYLADRHGLARMKRRPRRSKPNAG
jgi:hypothetical protein